MRPIAPGRPRWAYAPGGRLRAPIRLVLYGLAVVVMFQVATAFLYPVLLPLARLFTPAPSLAGWLNLAGVALATWLCLVRVEGRPWRDLGLGAAAARPGVLALGTLLGALAIGVPTVVLLALGQLRAEPMPDGSWWGAAAALLVTLAPSALFEELLVRGYPFQVLRESAGAPAAVLLTSVVFGVLHLQNPGADLRSAALVTLAGIFLAGVVLATGSLWAAFTAHLAWNWTLAGGLHALVSGLSFAAPDYRVVDAGPDWLTGGVWGPEGGAGAGVGMLGALAVLRLLATRRGGAGVRPPDPVPGPL